MSKKIAYSCPFVPAELIAAHGLKPIRVIPDARAGEAGPVPGVCPYARAFANTAARLGDAVVFTTACDQMRRSADMVSGVQVFLMNVPHTWQSDRSFELYLSELRRLGRFLLDIGGKEPSSGRLSAIMWIRNAERRATSDGMTSSGEGVPVAVVGGPVFSDHKGFFDIITKAGGRVALDGTETGERTAPTPLDMERLSDDPLRVLADAYFRGIVDPFRRPNTAFYDWLGHRIEERGIRGIILRRYLWCDIWHAEAERIKQHFGLPFVHIDVGDSITDQERTLTRLQSFMDMLR